MGWLLFSILAKFNKISFSYRTYEEHGLLVYHTFSSEGFVKLFMEDARIKVLIVSQDMPDVELNNFDQVCKFVFSFVFRLSKQNKN
jgi:hypothetical protein